MKYGSKDKLLEIFTKMKKDEKEVLEILKKTKFAPHDTDNGWAEPFITQLVLYDFEFDGELILIDHYNKNNYAPKEVFSNTIDYSQFIQKLINYFKGNNPGPVILDDSYVSISIFGVKYNDENKYVEFLVMDPHASDKPEIGIYIIILDEYGCFKNIIPKGEVLASFFINFLNHKPWMVYFPK